MLTPIAQEDGARLRGRWFHLRYSQSLAGQPVRLVVRFVRAAESEEHIVAAAALGRGGWTWRAPDDLQRLDVLAPIGRSAELRIDAVEPTTAAAILLGILHRKPRLLLPFLWRRAPARARCVAANEAFDLAAPEEFERFARERRRAFEPEGLDARLLTEAAAGPRLGFVIEIAAREDLEPLQRTLAAFAAQHDTGYRLLVLAPGDCVREIKDEGVEGRLEVRPHAAAPQPPPSPSGLSPSPCGGGDPIPASSPPPQGEGDHVKHGGGESPSASAGTLEVGQGTLAAARDIEVDYVARLLPGDEPAPEAVACLRAHLARQPELAVLYADSAAHTAAGGLAAQLKPDWSPTFQEGSDYVGRPCLVRRDLLREAASWRDAPGLGAARHGEAAIGHLKRVLLTRSDRPASTPPQAEPHSPAPDATIIIPTRDRLNLLLTVYESVTEKTVGRFEVVIVDNGTEDAATLAYLEAIESRPETRVLRRPGPFNFSSLINAGAEFARGPVLMLLNNDCEVIQPDWLQRLSAWASMPGVGAVGAKLLYADGSIQHAGVALGLGGEAGHRDRKRPRDHPGNLDRLAVPHEVAAVTAACLAVRRDTFHELGGFDEALPVAFNDIDFCLRLLRRGMRNILDPGAVLIHAESASRGRDDGPRRARFLREAALFRERWGDMLLDDPYLHPMFSTVRFTDRLG
jgi:GT2 family glycosyltransferase